MEPCRSGRISKSPDRYYRESFQTSLEDQVEDPTRYDKAVTDIDADHWHKAMDSEIESMYSNKVLDLVALPELFKPMGYKWVYKRKRGVDGKVETYKARLVAKGFTQKKGIDYDETFSLVAMLKYIRILLVIVCHYD